MPRRVEDLRSRFFLSTLRIMAAVSTAENCHPNCPALIAHGVPRAVPVRAKTVLAVPQNKAGTRIIGVWKEVRLRLRRVQFSEPPPTAFYSEHLGNYTRRPRGEPHGMGSSGVCYSKKDLRRLSKSELCTCRTMKKSIANIWKTVRNAFLFSPVYAFLVNSRFLRVRRRQRKENVLLLAMLRKKNGRLRLAQLLQVTNVQAFL